jgi:hypothetical protein
VLTEQGFATAGRGFSVVACVDDGRRGWSSVPPFTAATAAARPSTLTLTLHIIVIDQAELKALQAELEALRAEKAVRDTLMDTKVEYVDGLTSKGKAFQKIKISGGLMGGWGISIDPLQWDHLMAIRAYVQTVVDENRHKFVNAR